MENNELKHVHKCAAIFADHLAAERAVKELARSGFDMRRLSIVGRDYHTDEQVVGFYNAGDRVRHWGKLGGFWGAMFGIVFAPAMFWIPGLGPILTGGLISSAIMGMIEGGVIGAGIGGGASALAAALAGVGIPRDSVLRYERALRADKYLLLVHGSEADVNRAKELLSRDAEEAYVHQAT